jgi:antiviral helicase SLH1
MANDYMIDMVDKSLGELAESKCLEMYPNGDVFSTPLGKIMSYYYLSHKTIRHLVNNAKPSATFSDVLSWMSSATEYDELPVRHNEDLINAELSKNLPLPATSFDNLPMWDPHVKAFLLLQAHMSRIDLPISDYVGDQTSVLDQAIRIIQASIDILTELGYLSSCMQMITLLQCIKCARWPTDYPLSVLPGVSIDALAHDQNLPPRLQDFSAFSQSGFERTMKGLQLHPSQVLQFKKAANMIPDLKVDVQNVTALSLTVHLARQSSLADRDGKMFAPKFPKSQTEGWFVILCREGRDEVVAIKRVGWNSQKGTGDGNRPNARALIKFPDVDGAIEDGRKFDVWVASDGYLGMLYKVEGVEIPDVPRVVDDGKKGGKVNAKLFDTGKSGLS